MTDPAESGILRKITRFTLVGVVGAVADFGTRTLLLALGVPATVSRGGSYIVGSTVAYYLNSAVTFGGDRSRAEKLRAAASYVLCFCTAVLVDKLSRALLPELFPELAYVVEISWVVSQAAATALNFLLQNFWVFRRRSGEPS